MKPIKKVLLHDAVVSEIISYIQSNQLQPGDKLPTERNLAAFLSVSRPIIREALKILEVNNIITIKHGSGIFINTLDTLFFSRYTTDDDEKALLLRLKQLAESRLMLETYTAIEASKIATPQQIKELYDHEANENLNLQLMGDAYTEKPYVNLDFEILITQIYGNPFLIDFHKKINDLWQMNYTALNTNTFPLDIRHKDHINIIMAIESTDRKCIEKSIYDHISKVIASCERLID
jgi:DNA-binding FadR family transcriptional regulator